MTNSMDQSQGSPFEANQAKEAHSHPVELKKSLSVCSVDDDTSIDLYHLNAKTNPWEVTMAYNMGLAEGRKQADSHKKKHQASDKADKGKSHKKVIRKNDKNKVSKRPVSPEGESSNFLGRNNLIVVSKITDKKNGSPFWLSLEKNQRIRQKPHFQLERVAIQNRDFSDDL